MMYARTDTLSKTPTQTRKDYFFTETDTITALPTYTATRTQTYQILVHHTSYTNISATFNVYFFVKISTSSSSSTITLIPTTHTLGITQTLTKDFNSLQSLFVFPVLLNPRKALFS